MCLTLLGPLLQQFYPSLQRHNSPANSVRELFKSSTDSASLLVSIEKKSISFGLGVLLGERHKVGVFLKFLPTLNGPGRQTNAPKFWLKRG